MAEEHEKIVFEVDVTSLTRSLSDAQTELEAYKRDMEAAVEENGRFSEAANLAAAQVQAQAKSVKQAETALVKITQAQKALGGSLNDVIKNYDASGKSIDQNRKVLNALTAEYVKTANPSKEFTTRIKSISDELKKQEGALGDNRRNVGNYKEAILSSIGGLNIFGKSVGSVIDPLKNMGAGFANIGTSVGALAAAGIPLLIGAVQGFISVMQKFESVTEGVEDTFAGLNRVFDELITNTQVTSFQGFIDSMAKAFDEGQKLSQQLRALAGAQDVQTVSNAKAQKEIEALLIQARDRTKTEQERIRILDEASAKEKKNLEQNIKLAEERASIAQLELKRVIEGGLASDKQKKDLNTANRNLLELEKESISLQEKITVRRNALIDEQLQKEQKAAEERKKIHDKEIADLENKLKQEEELRSKHNKAVSDLEFEFNLSAREKLENSFAEKQAILNAQLPEELALITTIEEQKQKALAEFDQKQIDSEQAKQDALNKVREDARKQDIADQEAVAKQEQQIQQAKLQATESITGSIIGLANVVAEQAGANAAFFKALALVEIFVKMAVGIASAVSQGANVPWPANIAAIASGIAAVVGGIAGAITTLSKTSNPPKAKKFAEGGGVESQLVGGRPHSQGGTKYFGEDGNVVEFEKGERVFVLKKTASDKIGLLSRFNQYFGGRSWTDSPVGYAASGGAVITDGGFVARNSSEQANNLLLMSEFAKRIVGELPQPVVSVVEINRVNKSRDRSIGVSEL